jgi:hypothetical protein
MGMETLGLPCAPVWPNVCSLDLTGGPVATGKGAARGHHLFQLTLITRML